MKLEGKIALVTGSSQGIGQAIAIRLASEGANVAINYRSNPEGAQETVAKVEASGGKCYTALCPNSQGYAVQGDIGMVDEARSAIAETIAHFLPTSVAKILLPIAFSAPRAQIKRA